MRTVLLSAAAAGALALALPDAPQVAQSPAITRAYLDTTCAPCEDFWRFANGAWVDSATIPPGSNSISRDELIHARNTSVIQALLDSLAYAPERHTRTRLDRNVGLFHAACMDTTRTAADELRPVEPAFRALARITTTSGVSEAIGRLTAHSMSPLFSYVVVSDPANPTRHIGEIRGLFGWILPVRQVYTGTDASSTRMREMYLATLADIFRVLGQPAAAAAASARGALAVETAIVQSQPRDSGGPLAPHALDELQRLAPSFDWRAFARGTGRASLPPIYSRPATRAAIDSLMRTVSIADWRAYLQLQLAYAIAPVTYNSLAAAIAPFRNALLGLEGAAPRATLCVPQATRWLGDGVARAYVARAFSAGDRAAALKAVERVRDATRDRLATLEWLSEPTRRRAVAKLDAMQFWIGYPDRWNDDGGLTLGADAAAGLLMAARGHAGRRVIANAGALVDRAIWVEASPAFVDLSYYASLNTLLVTAAALQPSAFDPRADEVTNLAGIGFGFGHEIAHGFDSRGRLFNERGAREDWWTPDEAREYSRRAELVVAQYDNYTIIDTIRMNGRRTLSENIADIGGVALAHMAFKRATANERNVVVNGFTREQRFFIALAQGFPRRAMNAVALRNMAGSTHGIERLRLNGALANLPAFAAAFGCKDGDAMVLAAVLRGNIF